LSDQIPLEVRYKNNFEAYIWLLQLGLRIGKIIMIQTMKITINARKKFNVHTKKTKN